MAVYMVELVLLLIVSNGQQAVSAQICIITELKTTQIRKYTQTPANLHISQCRRTETNSFRLKSIPLSIPHQKMWKIIIYARRTVESGLSLSLSVCVRDFSMGNCSSSTVKYDRHNRQQAHRMVNAFDANSFVVTMVVAVSV